MSPHVRVVWVVVMAGLHFLLESKLAPHSGTYSIRESDLSSCRLSEINA